MNETKSTGRHKPVTCAGRKPSTPADRMNKILKKMQDPLEVLTLGDLAKLTKISSGTIKKRFIKDQIISYHTIPGSKDRRFLVRNVLDFIRKYEILPALELLKEYSSCSVIGYGMDMNLHTKLKTHVANLKGTYEEAFTPIGLGLRLSKKKTHLLIFSGMSSDQVHSFLVNEHPKLESAPKIILIDGPEQSLKERFSPPTKPILAIVREEDVHKGLFDIVEKFVTEFK